ncbi:MAG TPA: hypothetical protein VM051_08065 [Usitatibacter sp.]|nr:hypothetical protein [Usitatibacter sp.]
MPTPSWINRLAAARTEEELLSIVQEYLSVKADTIALLPPECRPGMIVDVQEIPDCAYHLVAHHSHEETARLIQSVAAVFARASVRLSDLRTVALYWDRRVAT